MAKKTEHDPSDIEVHDSTGNVFEDMGMRDTEERLAKAELARVIRKALQERGLTQAEAAEVLPEVLPRDGDRATRARPCRLLSPQ